jgi:spoIIIJ-associated protein
MDYSEKWGKDVDEAVRLALDDLGLTENQVMVTVLEEPAKGFLGLGSKLAKVRVEKIADIETDRGKSRGQEKKAPGVTRDLRKKNKPGASGSGGSGRGGSGGRDRSGGGGRGGSGGRDRDRDRSGGFERGGSGGRDRSGGGRGGSGGRDRDRDRSGGRSRYNDKRVDEDYGHGIELDLSDKPQFSEKPEGLIAVESNETSVFLKSILENMNLNVNIAVSENEECVYIEIDGEDAKTVIGKRGQTLDSIQYLTNLILNKDKEQYRRVIIDVEGYRSRREKTLEQLAAKLAHKAIRSGRSVRLEPMNPYERKVIHATLQKVDGITTRSEGEEPYRRVIIDKE